jgi:hypothetical protein
LNGNGVVYKPRFDYTGVSAIYRNPSLTVPLFYIGGFFTESGDGTVTNLNNICSLNTDYVYVNYSNNPNPVLVMQQNNVPQLIYTSNNQLCYLVNASNYLFSG